MPIRFPWTPDFGAQANREPRVRTVQFGDGYRQDQEDGLNTDLPSWEVQFSARSKAEADAIDAFFTARRSVERFLVKRPDSDYTVAGMGFGVGDGTTTVFQLQRTRINTVMDSLGLTYPMPTVPRTNEIRYSQDVSNAAWSKQSGVTIGSGFVAPDGTTTGQKIQEAVATQVHFISQSDSGFGPTKTLSIYAKAAERSWIGLGLGAVTAFFNLSTGVVGTVSSALGTAKIEAVGNGWYRCSLTTAATNTNAYYWPSTSDNLQSYAGTAGSGIYVWGAMRSTQGGAYIPTTSAAVTVTPSYYPSTADGFEAVDPNPGITIYKNGVALVQGTDWTLGASGRITFAVAPALNASLTWSGSGADWMLVTCRKWTPMVGQTWRISATLQREVA